MSRVLIVCADRVGIRMAGPAIRCWEMATLLARHGHDVHLSVPERCDLTSERFRVVVGTDSSLAQEEEWADVIVVQGLTTANHPLLARTSKRLVVDLYDPYVLETLEMYSGRPQNVREERHWPSLAALLVQLRVGDFFLCANERQRDFWMGCLVAADRVNPRTHSQDGLLRRLIDVAPFGTSSEPPRHGPERVLRGILPGIPEDAKIAIWAGGIYNWFDTLTLVRAWRQVRDRVPEAVLVFLSTSHPNAAVPEMEMAARTVSLSEELGLRGNGVVFNDRWVPYDRRADYLLEADIGVSTHFNHLETRISFRTRFLDYIWAGLPVVCTEGDAFAEWAQLRETGLVCAYEDVDGLADALVRILDDDELRARFAAHVRAEQPAFTWERALEPLISYCADPWSAADVTPERRIDPSSGWTMGIAAPSGVLRRLWWFWRRDGTLGVIRRVRDRLRREARARRAAAADRTAR